MEELHAIRQVAKELNVSTRTLRYYEQIGLVKPIRSGDTAYRSYDGETVARLRQIIVLRKLRVPLKQIRAIVESGSGSVALEVLQQNLAGIADEIDSLTTIKAVIQAFIERLHLQAGLDALEDDNLLEIIDTLTVAPGSMDVKEEKSMSDLNEASEKLNRLTDNEVRIIYVPPMIVASSQYVGPEPEGHAGAALDDFVRKNRLYERKPDMRHFGFNNPMPQAGTEPGGTAFHGYEMWVSIPEDLEVPPPLRRIAFHGGLYAAHAIWMGDFERWALLWDWVGRSEIYEHDWGAPRCTPYMDGMDWCLEEQLNYVHNVQDPQFQEEHMQLDLLVPIRRRESGTNLRP